MCTQNSKSMNYKHALMLCKVTHYDGNILSNVVSIRTVHDKPGFMLVDSQLAHCRINDNMWSHGNCLTYYTSVQAVMFPNDRKPTTLAGCNISTWERDYSALHMIPFLWNRPTCL